ncbi:MAG: response regulator transcription factor [Pyrinomonadaceae bacterium]|nr:response regulator transcription factor [Pyrinomonadaceae bacterium]
MKSKISVLIVDDHPIFRQGLTAVIGKDPRLTVVGEAGNGVEALDAVKAAEVKVIVLDIDMPVMDGLDTARALRNTGSDVAIIFLTMHKDTSILRSMKMLDVRGYVLKDSAMNEIVDCIRIVAAGKTYLSPALNEIVLGAMGENTESGTFKALQTLTATEKRVLKRIAESKTNREIAAELFVAVRTVETHRYNICSKLDLAGPNALLSFAIGSKKSILDRIPD